MVFSMIFAFIDNAHLIPRFVSLKILEENYVT